MRLKAVIAGLPEIVVGCGFAFRVPFGVLQLPIKLDDFAQVAGAFFYLFCAPNAGMAFPGHGFDVSENGGHGFSVGWIGCGFALAMSFRAHAKSFLVGVYSFGFIAL